MKILDYFRNIIRKDTQIIYLSPDEPTSSTKTIPVNEIPEFIIQIAGAIKYLGENIRTFDFKLQRRDGKILKSGNLYNLLYRPNDLDTFPELIERTLYDYMVYGAGFWIKKPTSKPEELSMIKMTDALILLDNENELAGIQFKDKQYSLKSLVKFINKFEKGNFVSKIDPVILLANVDYSLLKRLLSFDRSQGLSYPVIIYEGRILNEMQLRQLKVDLMNQLHGEPSNPIILNGPVKIERLGGNFNQQYVEQHISFAKEMLCYMFNIPNIGTYSNEEFLEVQIFLNAIIPMLRFFELRINRDLIWDKSIRFSFDLSSSFKYSQLLTYIARSLTLLLERGILSTNELRNLIGLESIDPDMRYTLTNLVVSEESKKQEVDVTPIIEKIYNKLENSEYLDRYFAGSMSFQDIKKYWTSIVQLPALLEQVRSIKGEPWSDRFENFLKKTFLECLVASESKDEFISKLKEQINLFLEE